MGRKSFTSNKTDLTPVDRDSESESLTWRQFDAFTDDAPPLVLPHLFGLAPSLGLVPPLKL